MIFLIKKNLKKKVLKNNLQLFQQIKIQFKNVYNGFMKLN